MPMHLDKVLCCTLWRAVFEFRKVHYFFMLSSQRCKAAFGRCNASIGVLCLWKSLGSRQKVLSSGVCPTRRLLLLTEPEHVTMVYQTDTLSVCIEDW